MVSIRGSIGKPVLFFPSQPGQTLGLRTWARLGAGEPPANHARTPTGSPKQRCPVRGKTISACAVHVGFYFVKREVVTWPVRISFR